MQAGDVGVNVYAFVGAYVINQAAVLNMHIQLWELGQPAIPMPPTIGLPPQNAPTEIAATTVKAMIIGPTQIVDQEGVTHPAGTWAYFVTTGAEFPKAGTYNTALNYSFGGVEIQSPIVTYQVGPTF